MNNLLLKLARKVEDWAYNEDALVSFYVAIFDRLPNSSVIHDQSILKDSRLRGSIALSANRQAEETLFFTFAPGGGANVDKGTKHCYTGPWRKTMGRILLKLYEAGVGETLSPEQTEFLSVFLRDPKDLREEFLQAG